MDDIWASRLRIARRRSWRTLWLVPHGFSPTAWHDVTHLETCVVGRALTRLHAPPSWHTADPVLAYASSRAIWLVKFRRVRALEHLKHQVEQRIAYLQTS